VGGQGADAPAFDDLTHPDELEDPGLPPVDLKVPLDSHERMMLGRIFNQEIERYNQEVAPRLGNVEQWRNDYELYPTQPNTRWKNASNVPAPFTHIYCQSHQTRLNQQIVQADPPFAVIARSQAAVDNTPQIEEAMASILEEAEWATHLGTAVGPRPALPV
jgi:hypothetical protein